MPIKIKLSMLLLATLFWSVVVMAQVHSMALPTDTTSQQSQPQHHNHNRHHHHQLENRQAYQGPQPVHQHTAQSASKDQVVSKEKRQAYQGPQPVHPHHAENEKRQFAHPEAHTSHHDWKRATVCNGDSSLCSRKYSNITYVGAHNSYAVGSLETASTGHNQAFNVTIQLNDGVRLLQAQAHSSTNSSSSSDSGIHLCHSSCSLVDGGSLESYLSEVKAWVDQHPQDVVTLLFVNSDNLPVSRFASAFHSSGLDSKAYTPPSSAAVAGTLSKDSWPTLSEIISGGKTVVTFIDNSADVSTIPYILPEFSNLWENAYDQIIFPFNCTVDRISSSSNNPQNLMFLSNHFLDNKINLFGTNVYVPNTDQINSTNSVDSILLNVNQCASSHSTYPTFLLLDFYHLGGAFQAVAKMNGIQYFAKPLGSHPNSTTSTTTTSKSAAVSSSKMTTFSSGFLLLSLLSVFFI